MLFEIYLTSERFIKAKRVKLASQKGHPFCDQDQTFILALSYMCQRYAIKRKLKTRLISFVISTQRVKPATLMAMKDQPSEITIKQQ